MPEPTEVTPRRLQIKKYPNRRYYDATHSRHLTLQEIHSLIQQGYDVQVLDAKTETDITSQVLTHIILEHDTEKLSSLPVPLLLRLIRMNDQLIKDFIEKYFNQALQSFLDYQQQLEEQIRRTHGLPAAFPSVSAWTRAVLEPFASVMARSRSERPIAPPRRQPNDELREVIRELRQQVAELKGRSDGKRPARHGRKTSGTRSASRG